MKTLCWLIGGYPSIDESMSIIDAYVKGGCEGIEWTIPYSNPYIGQSYRFNNESEAYKKCPDMDKHLDLIARAKKKYPDLNIYPSICKEIMLDIGVNKIVRFCKENNIDDIITIGEYDQEIIDELNREGIKNTIEVSYYLKESELFGAKNSSGYIIMQAFPYQEEIEIGYTKERLKECIKILRVLCPDRSICCAQGIRTFEDVKYVKEAGADYYILGSLLFDYYNDLDALSKIINEYKKVGE